MCVRVWRRNAKPGIKTFTLASGDGKKETRECEEITLTRLGEKENALPLSIHTAHNTAMVCIRPATMEDLLAMQRCNLLCLPENYQLKVRIVWATAFVGAPIRGALGGAASTSLPTVASGWSWLDREGEMA